MPTQTMPVAALRQFTAVCIGLGVEPLPNQRLMRHVNNEAHPQEEVLEAPCVRRPRRRGQSNSNPGLNGDPEDQEDRNKCDEDPASYYNARSSTMSVMTASP